MEGQDVWPELVVETVCRGTGCPPERIESLDAVVRLAVELVHEGREGRQVGTLFIVGDSDRVLERSRPLILDPLAGHEDSLRRLDERSFRETVKELAQLDGAFLVDDEGTFLSAARFIQVDAEAVDGLPGGLGARHAAAASISRDVDAIAVVVSESSLVRIFTRGDLRAEIATELFLGDEGASFAIDDPEVHELPDVGLTLALTKDTAA